MSQMLLQKEFEMLLNKIQWGKIMYKCRVVYDEWKCISEKQIVGKMIETDDFEGYVGLMCINKVKEAQCWNYSGDKVIVCDYGYKWLTILPKNEFYCITVMLY